VQVIIRPPELYVLYVQDAQTIVVLAANQRAKSAFFMFSPM
jgi:hypothetical protein